MAPGNTSGLAPGTARSTARTKNTHFSCFNGSSGKEQIRCRSLVRGPLKIPSASPRAIIVQLRRLGLGAVQLFTLVCQPEAGSRDRRSAAHGDVSADLSLGQMAKRVSASENVHPRFERRHLAGNRPIMPPKTALSAPSAESHRPRSHVDPLLPLTIVRFAASETCSSAITGGSPRRRSQHWKAARAGPRSTRGTV
jgi:hypothetical protein